MNVISLISELYSVTSCRNESAGCGMKPDNTLVLDTLTATVMISI